MSEESVIAALRALADQDRGREAPEEVETLLLAAFRRRRAGKKLKVIALAGLAAAAGVTMFFALPREHPKPVVRAATKQQPATVAAAPAPEPTPVRAAGPKRQKPREIVTEFFPLLDVAPPFEGGQLLRVTVPASTMREVGLPVNEDRLGDRVYADVLVGQEGLARAIRFVSYR
jgi:hypothetical protein